MRRVKGEGSWGVKTINGVEYQRYRKNYYGKTKEFYGKTKKEVLDKIKTYESGFDKLSDKKDMGKMSFYPYTKKWLFEWKENPIKPKTIDYYESLIENRIKDSVLGSMQLKFINSLEPAASDKIFKGLISDTAKNASKSTTDGLHTLINQVCDYGYRHGHFVRNFMENVPKVREIDVSNKKIQKRSLEYDEVMKLWDEMERKNTPQQRINGADGTYVYGILAYAVLFCCFTGLRYGEFSCLNWSDIDEENKTIVINKQFVTVKNRDENAEKHYVTLESTTKSEKSNRIIPLADQAYEVLEKIKARFPECYKPNHLIFSRGDMPLGNSNFNRVLTQMCIRCDIERITSHELRHSFGSILINEDEKNLYAVSDMMGHSTSDVTYKKYIHIFEKKKAETISVFNNLKNKKDGN